MNFQIRTLPKFEGTLAIELQNDLLVGAGVTIEGPAQIRAKVNADGSFEVIKTTAPGVTLRNLIFRDMSVTVGSRALAGLVGFTITKCKFTQSGGLELLKVIGGVVEDNEFELTDDRANGLGVLNLFSTTSLLRLSRWRAFVPSKAR